MADFINTIDALGDDAVMDSIINRSITEFKDDKLTFLGERAFCGCTNLQSVNLPNVQYYRSHALSGCTALTDVSLPELVDFVANSYAQGLFYGCTALQSISLPKLTRVYGQLFFGCSNLSSIELPVAESIGTSAFEICKALPAADLPKVTTIAARAYYGCTALKTLALRNTASVCTLSNVSALGSTLIEAGTGYIYVPTALVDSYKAAANWSTYANQFRSLEEWTVDNTVTGELIDDAANKHIVHFYNSDGTPLGYTIVAAGSDAVYSGADPVYPEDSSWKFKGFAPAPTNVTADLECYAQYQEPFALETASWATISEMSADGTAANYLNVGDTKSVHLKGTMGTISLDTTLYVYVLGINHNREVEGSGIHFGTFKDATGKDVGLCDSQIGAGSVDAGTKYFNMNHWGKYNYGGWAGCDMRYDILGSTNVAPSNYGSKPASGRMGYDATNTCTTNPVADTLMSCLPQELRSVMKPITKYTDNVAGKSNQSGDVTASLDYLPLLAEFEVAGARSNANEAEQNYQKQYDFFADGKTKYKYQYTSNKTDAILLRSPVPKYNDSACIISNAGYMTFTTVGVSALVVPIFMV